MSGRVRVGGNLHIGLSVDNVSYGGVFIRTLSAPPPRSDVTLEVSVPGVRSALVIPGTVAFVTSAADAAARNLPAGFAVEFTRPLSTNLHLGLERLLASLGPDDLRPEPHLERTEDNPVLVPSPGDPLQALRRRVVEQDRQIALLKAEIDRLNDLVRLLKAR